MSRKTPASNVEQNRVTLKSLVKLESNKSCADCKKNKHPRWASWNLGIFVCIRCSGIHRGMGTHISRVKSVDLDSWTDEQTQSMVNWGNARANKYWESKLAPGHVPSESKMENFIRTKYESKRWIMEGGMPDPSELDGDEAAVPTQASASVQQSLPQRQASSRAAPAIDLFGDDMAAPARPSTGPPLGTQPPPKAEAAKQAKPAESLLGLDFFGGSAPSAPARPVSDLGGLASAPPPSKTDLKQSILSLYASAPKAAPQAQSQSAFGGFQNAPQTQTQSSFGGMDDAFGSLNLSSPSAAPAPSKPSAFAGLTNSYTSSNRTTSTTPSLGAGGSFFDPIPKSPPTTSVTKPATTTQSSSNNFPDLFSSAPASTTTQSKAPTSSMSLSNDLFDLSAPEPNIQPAKPQPNIQTNQPNVSVSSPFNLSSSSISQPAQAQQSKPLSQTTSSFPVSDPWGSSDIWGAPESNTAVAPPPNTTTNTSSNNTFGGISDTGGWGSFSGGSGTATKTKPAETTIAADEDFGGWNSAPVPAAAAASSSNNNNNTQNKNSGFGGSSSGNTGGGNDDLFGNVWG